MCCVVVHLEVVDIHNESKIVVHIHANMEIVMCGNDDDHHHHHILVGRFKAECAYAFEWMMEIA